MKRYIEFLNMVRGEDDAPITTGREALKITLGGLLVMILLIGGLILGAIVAPV